MVNRQRREALPLVAAESRAKQPNQDGLRVWHVDAGTGRKDWEKDFSEINLSQDLLSMFAHVFATRLGPGGSWNSPVTASKKWSNVRQLAKYSESLPTPLRTVGDLSKDLLISFSTRNRVDTSVKQFAHLFRDHPLLPNDARDWAYQREQKKIGKKGAYTEAEMAETRERVFTELAKIETRITESIESAQGPAEPGSIAAVHQAMLQVPYDHASVTAAYASYAANSGLNSWAKRSAQRPKTITQVAEMIFLRRRDVAILVLAILINTGWNLSSVLLLKPVQPQANPDNPDRGVYSITLDKRRRGNAARFESRHLRYVNAGARSDVFTRVIRMSAPTRQAMNNRPDTAAAETLFGFYAKDGRFGVMTTYSSTDMGRRGWPPGMSSPARIRKTVNVIENRRANQNDEATHFSTYVMPDPLIRQESASIIAAGLEDALADVDRFKGALAENVPLASDDAVLSACRDKHSSPFISDESGCLSSFLLCLACSNAVITPAHIPRLVVAWDSLNDLRSALPEAQWTAIWAPTFSRLCDLKLSRISPQQWETGRLAISPSDINIVAQLIQGDFDVR